VWRYECVRISPYVIESGVFYNVYHNGFIINSLGLNEWKYIALEFYSIRIQGITILDL